MRPNPAANTIRALLAAIPDDRLREIFLDLALAIPAIEEPKGAPRNGRRRRRKGGRLGKSKSKVAYRSRAWLDAYNAKRHEKRRLAREARAAEGFAPQTPRPQAQEQRRRSPRQRCHRLRRCAMGARPQARAANALARSGARTWNRRGRRPAGVAQSDCPRGRQPRGRGPIPHTVKMGSFAIGCRRGHTSSRR
jgi:hypothetical protein